MFSSNSLLFCKITLHRQSQKSLQNIKHQLHVILETVTYFFLFNSWLLTVHLFSGRVRKQHLSRGKETLVAQLWHRCSKMLIACSPTLIDTYIRPPVLPQQHLEMPQSTAFPLSSISLSVPLLIPTSSCSVVFPSVHPPLPPFSSFIRYLIQRSSMQLLSVPWYLSVSVLEALTC